MKIESTRFSFQSFTRFKHLLEENILFLLFKQFITPYFHKVKNKI